MVGAASVAVGGASAAGGGARVESSMPKAMIDNPGAAATKTTSLIKPRPVKVGGQDSPSPGLHSFLIKSSVEQILLSDSARPGPK